MSESALFDEWQERYEQWFTTPIGKLVLQFEGQLVQDFLQPRPGNNILDAGCGTGIFTTDFLATGARVVGLDISAPMLRLAIRKSSGCDFAVVQGDMRRLPFAENYFDKTVSITALEFIADARGAIAELFRVTRPGGCVVVATLNSLSPWAARRKVKTQKGQRHILEHAYYRSPEELLACSPVTGVTRTAIHFQKDADPAQAVKIEEAGRQQGLNNGAFVVVRWMKPS